MFGPLLEVAVSKKCTTLWQEAHFDETCENCRMFGPLFDDQIVLPCRKSARRCGAKHIWKSKPGPVKTKVTSAIISPFSWSNSVSLCVMVVPVDSICLCSLLPRLESCRQAIMHCRRQHLLTYLFRLCFIQCNASLHFGSSKDSFLAFQKKNKKTQQKTPNNSRLQHFFQFFISPLWGECAFLWSAGGPTHHSAAGFLSAISVSTSVFIPHGLVHFFQELFEVITILLTVLCL